ncbi:MAG TPA: hypothetical protein VHR72_06265, partial [Gemmataceae bacterium]|nr:hypothetical protein [Gemmataceae bacterium]
MPIPLPVRRVVLFKHGVGHFEREAIVDGADSLSLTFKQSEISDVLKSLTVLDLDGGIVTSVSYDSTKPLEQLLAEVALDIPDQGSLVGLLPQVKGARVRLHTGVSDPIEGVILGIDDSERALGDGVVKVTLVSVLTDNGEIRTHDLHTLASLQIMDAVVRGDLDFYLRTILSAKKKDSRSFTFFAQGEGKRTILVSYVLEAPVWKATYRILLGEADKRPTIQGWAVVDNTGDEDWQDVELALVSGLPVSFRHDLYTPRYIRRPEVKVQETTGVLPPETEYGMALDDADVLDESLAYASAPLTSVGSFAKRQTAKAGLMRAAPSSMPAQTRERAIGDLFEYRIEHPVTIRRNQSALVPIVLREFDGKTVLLYDRGNRAENPLRCVEFVNDTGLTLEGGPVTVLDGGSYVGEAMLDTMKPTEHRFVAYAVELSVGAIVEAAPLAQRVHRVVVRDGVLWTHAYDAQVTTYRFANKAGAEYALYVDHPRPGEGTELFETDTPVEITANRWRFKLSLPASKSMTFVVRLKTATQMAFQLVNMTEPQLAYWIDQRHLDSAAAQVLRQVLDLQRRSNACQTELARLEQERTAIHAEQNRIRENMKALGDRSAEKELRDSFV